MNEFDSLFGKLPPVSPSRDGDTIQTGQHEQKVFERDVLQRKHLSEPHETPRVSDIVTPKRYEVYLEGLRGNTDVIAVTVDQDGILSGRDQPPEGCAWVVVEAVDQQVFDKYMELIQPYLERAVEVEA